MNETEFAAEIFNYILEQGRASAEQIEQAGFDRAVTQTSLKALFEKGFIWQVDVNEQRQPLYSVVVRQAAS